MFSMWMCQELRKLDSRSAGGPGRLRVVPGGIAAGVDGATVAQKFALVFARLEHSMVWGRGPAGAPANPACLATHAHSHRGDINGLQAFWRYCKRSMSAGRGIQRERVPFYLAEDLWRYDYRNRSPLEKGRRVMKLLAQQLKRGS